MLEPDIQAVLVTELDTEQAITTCHLSSLFWKHVRRGFVACCQSGKSVRRIKANERKNLRQGGYQMHVWVGMKPEDKMNQDLSEKKKKKNVREEKKEKRKITLRGLLV